MVGFKDATSAMEARVWDLGKEDTNEEERERGREGGRGRKVSFGVRFGGGKELSRSGKL